MCSSKSDAGKRKHVDKFMSFTPEFRNVTGNRHLTQIVIRGGYYGNLASDWKGRRITQDSFETEHLQAGPPPA